MELNKRTDKQTKMRGFCHLQKRLKFIDFIIGNTESAVELARLVNQN